MEKSVVLIERAERKPVAVIDDVKNVAVAFFQVHRFEDYKIDIEFDHTAFVARRFLDVGDAEIQRMFGINFDPRYAFQPFIRTDRSEASAFKGNLRAFDDDLFTPASVESANSDKQMRLNGRLVRMMVSLFLSLLLQGVTGNAM
jgi:hypothetical protein